MRYRDVSSSEWNKFPQRSGVLTLIHLTWQPPDGVQFRAQCRARDTQSTGCLDLIAADVLQYLVEDGAIQSELQFVIDVGLASFKQATNQFGDIAASIGRRGLDFSNQRRAVTDARRQTVGRDDFMRRVDECVFDCALQFAHIARPRVGT